MIFIPLKSLGTLILHRRQCPIILTVNRLVYSVTASSTLPSVPVLFGYYKSAENVSFKKTMGSSKQPSEGLKNRIIKFYKNGKGYKKPSSRLNITVSTVRNTGKEMAREGYCESQEQVWQTKGDYW